jgi:hypothetical protein
MDKLLCLSYNTSPSLGVRHGVRHRTSCNGRRHVRGCNHGWNDPIATGITTMTALDLILTLVPVCIMAFVIPFLISLEK